MSNGSNLNFMCRMVLEWREHEHDDVEGAVRVDLMAQQALRACGLYNFWWLKSQAKTIADVGGLLGFILRVILDRWDVPHHRGGGHILYYWTFPMGGSSEPMFSRSRRWPGYR